VKVSKGSCLYRNVESEVCMVQISGLWVSTSQLLNTHSSSYITSDAYG
jgi:hypothetical protein